jgi:hypothetical protein
MEAARAQFKCACRAGGFQASTIAAIPDLEIGLAATIVMRR